MRRKKYVAIAIMIFVLTGCGKSDSTYNTQMPTQTEVITDAATEVTTDAATEATTEVTTDAATEVTTDATTEVATEEPTIQLATQEEETMIYAHIGSNVLTIRPENNSSAEAFIELLADGDITIDMHDYANFEKVGSLGTSLPRNDTNITTTAGDVILYQGNQITIYYDTNTWSFTKLGKVQNLSQNELKNILGNGNVTVTFSLSD